MFYWKKLDKAISDTMINETMNFFNRTLKGHRYEVRDGQTDMALDIAEAMAENQHIVVEAGVGIGKSFAYLVPLILYNKFDGNPVVIATSSIALQEQLKDDIKKVSRLLNEFPKINLAKGKRNYACLERCIDISSNDAIQHELKNNMVNYVRAGVIDKADLPSISNDIWTQINAENCNPYNCSCKSKCVFIKDRAKLRSATGIIVTNQDMLIQNLKNRKDFRNEIFNSNIKYIVVDEAHNFEEKVRNAFTSKWTYNSLKHSLYEVLKYTGNKRSSMTTIEEHLLSAIKDLFHSFSFQIENQIDFNDFDIGTRYYLNTNNIDELILNAVGYLDSFLIQLTMNMDDRYEGTDNAYESLERFLDFLKTLTAESSSYIYWATCNRKEAYNVSVEVCPKRVDEIIQELVFDDPYIRTIFTSATITHTKGKTDEECYSYFTNNISFPINDVDGFISTPKDSPFPYDTNSMLYTSDNLPDYKLNPDLFIELGVKEIINLAEITDGKMLVLFTSKKDMNEVYKQMMELKLRWNILVQDGSSSQMDILSRFKMDVNSILLGTGTFWEGISIEGESLSCVVIFRLPFPVPDPIIDYKCNISNDKMKEVLLPQMIIRLKQGIGRLIRSSSDKGIVAILDPRLGEMSKSTYKQVVFESLPIKKRDNQLNSVKDFYDSLLRQ